MTAYYNEIDPFAAQWLRELISEGHIAPGIVDTRSIEDVTPADLAGFTQCHFFAGIGVWSYALRLAGWSDDRPIWTGSCPCQPFSAAGKGGGFADERHLWPAWHYLIEQCRPADIFGEQVASKDGLAWFDLVQADLEGAHYAAGTLDTCSAGSGAPHIRQRLRFAAKRLGEPNCCGSFEGRLGRTSPRQGFAVDATGCVERMANSDEQQRHRSGVGRPRGGQQPSDDGSIRELDHHHHQGLEGFRRRHQTESGRIGTPGSASSTGQSRGMADRDGREFGQSNPQRDEQHGRQSADRGALREGGGGLGHNGGPSMGTGPTNGLWRDADWLFCRDGKWRPVEPGTFPLAHGSAARVGRLRGYGNAVDAEATRLFIEAYLEAEGSGFEPVRTATSLPDEIDEFSDILGGSL